MALPHAGKMRAWLEDVAHATAKAAKKALAGREPGRTVKTGASGAPTSALDDFAERVIIDRLADAPVALNLLSEEIGIIPGHGDWWLVADPVDGTRNALRGIPFHCVSLALARRDLKTVEMGIVRTIPTGEVYWAQRGKGATLDGKKLRVRPFDRREIVLGTALDYVDAPGLPGGPNVHFRDLGSAALEMCYVAQGRLDGFYAPQPLVRLIDIAASTLIVREAGGQVYDVKRRPLNVPMSVSTRFGLLAANDRRIWRDL